ncbi:MAG TPA: hypothetical protein VK814_12815 [Acidobacteriaceae bacterium]|nr:hypothetical protein [Acidobacteriaceae bacterium]
MGDGSEHLEDLEAAKVGTHFPDGIDYIRVDRWGCVLRVRSVRSWSCLCQQMPSGAAEEADARNGSE